MSLTRDVPRPPSSGDGLFRVIWAGLRHLLMLDIVPGFELLRGELVWLRHRERHHFLDHRLAFVGCSYRPVGGNLGVKKYLHL
eukprot:14745798-Heterocapsa_arctica.AAC.1